MAKRGRKPKSERRGYFMEREEEAVVRYLNTDDKEEKNEIFNTILKPAFTKMVESIIRRYKLFVPMEYYEETFNDTMSNLITKLDYFKPEKNKKAYSYYGTICKRSLILKINQYKKRMDRNQSYDDISEKIENNMSYSSGLTIENDFATDLLENIKEKIKEQLEEKDELNENERKVGEALVELFKNWEDIPTEGTNKLNKNSILYYLREMTLLETKVIRDSMRKYKKLFFEEKARLIEENEPDVINYIE